VTSDRREYGPPIICMVRDCGADAVVDQFVGRSDGTLSLEVRFCKRHEEEWRRTGTIPNGL
jgi:hypothetical protein